LGLTARWHTRIRALWQVIGGLIERGVATGRRNGRQIVSGESERTAGEYFLGKSAAEIERWGTDAPPLAVPDDESSQIAACRTNRWTSWSPPSTASHSATRGNLLSLSRRWRNGYGQIISIYGEVHEKALGKLRSKELPKEMKQLIDDDFLAFFEAIGVKPGSDDVLILSCPLPRKLTLPAQEGDMPPNPDERELQKATLAAIKAAGIPVRDDVNLSDVVAKFRGS
jgi:hypothetical protein